MTDDPQYTESNDASQPEERRPNGQTFFGGLRERLEWALRASVLVFILAAAAFLSAITAMRVAIHGREVNMPNLVGKNVSEAGSMLSSRGLGLRVADHGYLGFAVKVGGGETPPPGEQEKGLPKAQLGGSVGERPV